MTITVKQLRAMLNGVDDNKKVLIDIVGEKELIEAIPQCTIETDSLTISAVKIKNGKQK